MGQCYWHDHEVYPGHPCPDCEKKLPWQLSDANQRYSQQKRFHKEQEKNKQRCRK